MAHIHFDTLSITGSAVSKTTSYLKEEVDLTSEISCVLYLWQFVMSDIYGTVHQLLSNLEPLEKLKSGKITSVSVSW